MSFSAYFACLCFDVMDLLNLHCFVFRSVCPSYSIYLQNFHSKFMQVIANAANASLKILQILILFSAICSYALPITDKNIEHSTLVSDVGSAFKKCPRVQSNFTWIPASNYRDWYQKKGLNVYLYDLQEYFCDIVAISCNNIQSQLTVDHLITLVNYNMIDN